MVVIKSFQSATDYWLEEGVDGILLHGVEQITVDSFWTNMRDAVKNHTKDGSAKK